MGENVKVTLEGGAELDRALRAIDATAAGEDLEAAVLAGAEPILEQAVGAVHSVSGLLASSLIAETVEKDRDHVTVLVGAFGAPHAHLVEYGHQLVKGGPLDRGGAVVGHVPAHPFLRPAFDEQKEQAVEDLADTLRAKIEQAVGAGQP